jgi:TPP-dependent pyruvate/acetoin dehydrogenase alpha subunit
MDGKDLHIGDMGWGILPATAPLSISTLSIAGMAMAFSRERSGRAGFSFIGEGGSSLGEWHEAINLCAARKLPAVFCIENNQTALSTPVCEQSAVPGCGGVHVGGRSRPRRRGPHAHRARVHAHVRPRAP